MALSPADQRVVADMKQRELHLKGRQRATDAILWKLHRDHPEHEYLITVGNGGTWPAARPVDVSPTEVDALVGLAERESIDFTVVGPAVNEVARIAALCRSVERDVLLSQAFAEAAEPDDRAGLVSVGRYALRGVGRAQELYTLEPS